MPPKGSFTPNKVVDISDNKIGLIVFSGNIITLDFADYDLVKNHRWFESGKKRENTKYARTHIRKSDNSPTTIQMHQLLLITDLKVDHIDGNGLNNCRDNLRVATAGQNQHNRNKQINNTSGYMGVSWYTQGQKWRARITIDDKEKHLGYFSDKIEAAKVRDKAALELHGEFASLNFPTDFNDPR